jgi:hypothetical protein
VKWALRLLQFEFWTWSNSMDTNIPEESAKQDVRRQFLLRCGRFAAITPPAMTMLLAVASTPDQARASGYHRRRYDD